MDAFIAAVGNKDEHSAWEKLTKFLWNSISCFDYGKEYGHGMLKGFSPSREFSPDSNDKAGPGGRDRKRVLVSDLWHRPAGRGLAEP